MKVRMTGVLTAMTMAGLWTGAAMAGTARVPAAPWNDAPAWVTTPEKGVEMMFDPRSMPRLFAVGQRQFACTPVGWLERLEGGAWRALPELYGRAVSPREVRGGKVWATEGGELLEIEPANWSVLRRFKLPPGAVMPQLEEGHYWTLEGRDYVGGRPGHGGHQAIARYSLDGRQTLRYTPTPAPGFDKPIGRNAKAPPHPLIAWTAFDAEGVWMLVTDFRGEEPNDAPIRGPDQLVRLDAAGGQARSVVIGSSWMDTLTDAPGRLLWARQIKANAWAIQQLDKKTLAVSQAAVLEVEYITSMRVVGEVLWMYKPGAVALLAFSLKDFKPVDLKNAGPLPDDLPYGDRRSFGDLLGSDANGAWLPAGPTRIGRIDDDGRQTVRDFGPILKPADAVYQGAAAGPCLYAFWQGKLLRIPAAGDEATVLDLDPKQSYLESFVVGDRVWLRKTFDSGDWLTADLLLGNLQAVQPRDAKGQPSGLATRAAVADRGELLAAVPGLGPGGAPKFLRLGTDGKLAAVESFDRFLPAWFRKHHGREPRGGDLSVYGMAGMFAANGRVVMTAKTAPGRLAIWSYDPAADRWADAAIETKAYPVQATPSLAIDEEFIYQIEADRLSPIVRRPRWLVPPNWQTRMAVTSRYLYVRLPWGLLRVARGERPAVGLDAEGKEQARQMDLSFVKTDKGWRMGE